MTMQMKYAILGDIHSSKEDLRSVLAHIIQEVPQALLIGTGDLFECTVSKRHISDYRYNTLEEVMLLPDGFVELLTFPSVKGNQEERILFITDTDDPLLGMLSAMPEKMELGMAEVIHGHQWKWGGDPWALVEPELSQPVTFFGHSHTSGLIRDGHKEEVLLYGHPYELGQEQTLVNVGAVIDDQEWVLFDSIQNIVTFMKAN